MSEPRPWHRLFALSWIDFFEGTSITVETEMDLSLKQQFIDLVLIRKGSEPIPRPLPDGFDDLVAHNLISFKSHHEALDGWALWELIGHYVNYRKQSSPSFQELLPESDFRLFAVCARYPQNLADLGMLTPLREGVFDVTLGTLRIRVIVVAQLPQEEHNAMLHLFSANRELLSYGQEHYRMRSAETSTLLSELFKVYREDTDMSEKLKEFVRQSLTNLLKSLSPEERLKGLPAEDRVKGLTAEELGKAIDPETLAALIRQYKANGSSAHQK